MKTIITLSTFLLLSITVSAQEFKFEKEVIDYGKINQNANGKRTFEFTNIGNQPLIITRVQSSCGCTIAKKPEKPIMPGEKGKITVSYATNRLGGFHKSITVFSNAKIKLKRLQIKGYVATKLLLEKEKSMLSNDF